VVVLLTLAAAVALAPVEEPVWIRRPSGKDIALAYPAAAMGAGLEGSATLNCVVTDAATLTDCALASETPEAAGFGAATQKLSSGFSMKPLDQQGRPVAGRPFKLTVHYRLPAGTVRRLPKVEVRRPGMATGRITLNCRINPEADLDECKVVGPTHGLEAAAFELVDALNAASPTPAERGHGEQRAELTITFTN
jgi:TonB family protein